MNDQSRPTHWHGVDSHDDWPQTGCPIDWQWLESFETDGDHLYRLLTDIAIMTMRMPEEGRPDEYKRYVSYLTCHGLAAMNYL